MKNLFIIAALAIGITSCTKDAKQVNWKVEVSASEPFSSANVQADLKGNQKYNAGTGEGYNQTTWVKEFKASKMNDVKLSVTSYNGGTVTLKIYLKKDLVKEQTFTNSGSISQHSLTFQN